MRRNRTFAFVLPAVLSGVAYAGELQKVWDFNVGESAVSPLGVYSLSFSPDGRRIAAVVGGSAASAFVQILDAGNPQISPKRFDIAVAPSQSLRWSLSGQQLILGTTIVDVSSQTACRLPGPGFFFVGANEVAGKMTSPFQVAFYDLSCHRTHEWELGPFVDVDVYDGSAEQGLLLYKRSGVGVFLMEVGTQKTRALLGDSLATGGRIADGGKAFCVVIQEVVTCQEVGSRKEVKYKHRILTVLGIERQRETRRGWCCQNLERSSIGAILSSFRMASKSERFGTLRLARFWSRGNLTEHRTSDHFRSRRSRGHVTVCVCVISAGWGVHCSKAS